MAKIAPLDIARDHARSLPLDQVDVSNPALFEADVMAPYFERLRNEDPVHYCADSRYGPYWSITRYRDIMAVDTDHNTFSSDALRGGITIRSKANEFILPMFIAMDPPRHGEQRKTVSPIVSPDHLKELEGTIRQRAAAILDSVPRNEDFDWVKHVSVELTTQMLATLFDFPWDDRHLLTHWSDVITSEAETPTEETVLARRRELQHCGEYFVGLWNERVKQPPKNDLVSMLCHGAATRDMDYREYVGNVILLIVGGNDTTRNSISGGVVAFAEFPEEEAKLRGNPGLMSSFVPELIRWQTPLAHMRRTAVRDVEFGGKTICEGDKVVMWYISGNRDEAVINNADRLVVDRPNPRQHLSFGFGIHRCVGNRLAELQLRILWEEALKRFETIEVREEPQRVFSSFVRGYAKLMVRVPG